MLLLDCQAALFVVEVLKPDGLPNEAHYFLVDPSRVSLGLVPLDVDDVLAVLDDVRGYVEN